MSRAIARPVRAAVLLLLVAGACRREEQPPAPGEPIRLVFKHMRMLGDPAVLENVLSRFEAGHPGVRVVSEPLPNDTDLQHQFFVTNLEAGSRDFDVLNLDVIWVPEFARAGWLLDLTDRLPPARVREAFFPAASEAVTWGGRTRAVPWFADVGLLYWREDLLERHGRSPPRTWTELEETTRAILDAESDSRLTGFIWQGRQYEGLVCVALELIRGFGGEVFDDGPGLERPQTLRALAYMRRLIVEGLSPPQTTSADEEVARHLFGEGRALFMRNWPYAWPLLGREGSPVRGRVGAGPLPAQSGQDGGGTLGGWQLGINAHVPEWKREAAWALVEHLTSDEVQRRLAQAYGFNPARMAPYADAAWLRQNPLGHVLKAALETARPRPVSPYYLMITQVLQPEFSAAITGIRSPADAMERAGRQVRLIEGELE